MAEALRRPMIGRIVVYREEGGYDVPAVITATTETVTQAMADLYIETYGAEGVHPLTDREHVHLAVFWPLRTPMTLALDVPFRDSAPAVSQNSWRWSI